MSSLCVRTLSGSLARAGRSPPGRGQDPAPTPPASPDSNTVMAPAQRSHYNIYLALLSLSSNNTGWILIKPRTNPHD